MVAVPGGRDRRLCADCAAGLLVPGDSGHVQASRGWRSLRSVWPPRYPPVVDRLTAARAGIAGQSPLALRLCVGSRPPERCSKVREGWRGRMSRRPG
jgi:hypothetical protein